MNSSARLNRLFAADGKCLVVALDHGLVNEAQYLRGIENIAQLVTHIAGANPDALLLTVGYAPLLQGLAGRAKPSLVFRVDTPNVYRQMASPCLFDELLADPVEQAVRLDAACVITHLFFIAEQPQVYQQCIQNICRLRSDCDRYGMPLMVEARVMELNGRGGYTPGGDPEKLAPLARQAIELGVDILKVDPPDNPEDLAHVIAAVGDKPVLALGGSVTGEAELLARTAVLLQQGARGIVYGRNVFSQPNPAAMTRALLSIVHNGATPVQAFNLLRGSA